MKKVILLLCFIPATAFCQVSYNFESGQLYGWVQSTPDHWSADTILPLSGRYSLHHTRDNTEAGTDQAGIRLMRLRPSSGTTKWSILIRHAADPSSSNNWGIFLMADNDPAQMYPGGNVSGYAVGINLSGYDDTLRLWRVNSGKLSAIITIPVNWQIDIGTSIAAKIEAERDSSGKWTVTISSGSLCRNASCFDPELLDVRWFGVYYKYTSTRDRLFWIDDISIDGVFLDAGIPPGILEVKTAGRSSIDVYFDDDISALSAQPFNFLYEPSGDTAVSVIFQNQHTLNIYFSREFPNRTQCTLTAKNICNDDSACSGSLKFDFTPAWAEPGDIIISEIMADPLPPVSLPLKEYLEISNRTGFSFSLHGWKFVTGPDTIELPDSIIAPNEIFILCSLADIGLFSKYGKVIGLKSFPPLNDDGRTLLLLDDSGRMIHGVKYSPQWYGDILKAGGGWSLEIIDTGYPFYYAGNWKASVSPAGGTPGRVNSVAGTNPDLIFKGFVNAYPADSSKVIATFSEPVRDPESITGKLAIDGRKIASAVQTDQLGMEYLIQTDEPFVMRKVYRMNVLSGLTDYAGNQPERTGYSFGLTEPASVNEIVFNEILFNPLPGDGDYIEFSNNSDKIVNAGSIFLVSVNDETADTSELVGVSDTARCIFPGTLYAITTGREAILKRYFSSVDTNLFEVEKLPSMADDNGHLVLVNAQAERIDDIKYSEKMHFQLLSGTEGISLEKIRPSSISGDQKNWHSASESSGWGTPGEVNSIYTEIPGTDNKLTFSSTRITPDNDGYEDLLVMDLRLTGNSNVVTILIFDEAGNLVRKLVQNLFAGNELSVVWDGSGDDGSLVSSGIYIILIMVFDETGKTINWKKPCAVIR